MKLSPKTAPLSQGSPCVCSFLNDDLSGSTLKVLADSGVKLIALRSAGFNHVDLHESARIGLTWFRFLNTHGTPSHSF